MTQRIVSLVPSLTELVYALGRGRALIGRTRFCTEPAGEIDLVPRIGGTKNPDIAEIASLAPDLVIANREENRKEDIDALEAYGLDVLLTDPNTVDEAIAMILDLGERLDAGDEAKLLAADIWAALAEVEPREPRPRVFAAVWQKPLMGLGGNAYGHDLMERCGALNVLRDRPRYPELSLEELTDLAPDLILLPDEPFPFSEKYIPDFERFAPARVIDGKLLWWYGSRMPMAIRELSAIFCSAGAS